MNNTFKNIAVWLVVALVLMTVFNQFSARQQQQSSVPYSRFIQDVNSGGVEGVTIDGKNLTVQKSDGQRYSRNAGDRVQVGIAEVFLNLPGNRSK